MSYCLNPDCSKPQNPPGTKFCLTCGSKLLLGDRYRATQPIGQGGFGRTFLAVDEYKPSQPRCVVKQFFPQAQGTNNAQKAAELFTREAVRLEDLGNHPQIPELFAHFEQNGRQYLVQQFIDGQNLSDELEKNGVFNETQILQLLEDLLPVLQFIHAKQVIHRDIKPENIIRRSPPPSAYQGGEKGGQLVLVDFGASKFATHTALGKVGTVIGSAGFAAPEQIVGKAFAASDLYSLGVTCVYLLTRQSPFDLFDSDRGTWVWRYYLKAPVSDRLGLILDKLLQPNLSDRYQSAAEVLQDLASPPQPPSKNASFQGASPRQPSVTTSSRLANFLRETRQIAGKLMPKLGNDEQAILSYEAAIARDPDNFKPWYEKGRLCWKLQRLDEAILCFETTLEIKPNHFDAWRSLGILYYSLKRYEEAAFSYERALQIYPNQPTIWLCRSAALKQLGNAADAEMSFEKAKQLLPHSAVDRAAILLQAWEILIRY